MFTVYVLYSLGYNKIYIGYTSNLEKRLESHNELSGKGWTMKFRLWKLVYKEEYESKGIALKQGKQLKTAKGREFIWKMIK